MKPLLTVPMFEPGVFFTPDGLVDAQWLYRTSLSTCEINFHGEVREWTSELMSDAIRALLPPRVPFLGYEKKVFYEYEANAKIYPAG